MKKLKQNIIVILILTILIELQLACINSAKAVTKDLYDTKVGANATSSFETKLTSNKSTLNPGDTFTVTVYLNNLKNTPKGIVAIAGQLEFNTSVLELYEKNGKSALTGQNGWNLSANDKNLAFNKDNFKFVADNNDYITANSKIFTIAFKVKNTVKKDQAVKIYLKNVEASGGAGVISAVKDSSVTVNIQAVIEEKITSDKYTIKKNVITRIPQKTTVKTFKQNVTTKQKIVFTNKDGKTLSDNDIISTATKIKVGNTLNYTLSVIGDIDRDGKISINDLALIKLHYIDSKNQTGINLISADIDGDEKVTINDIAQMKIILIK